MRARARWFTVGWSRTAAGLCAAGLLGCLTGCGEGAASGGTFADPCDGTTGILGVFWGNHEGVGGPNDEPGSPSGGDIWALAEDLSAAVQLTHDAQAFPPSISDDGRRVYFGRGPGGIEAGVPATPEEAWRLDAETGHLTRLFDAFGVQSLEESPDGQHLAYIALAGEPSDLHEQLFVLDLVTGESKPLAPPLPPATRQTQYEPVWNTDGSALAYLLMTQPADSILFQITIQLVDWQTGKTTELYSAPLNTGVHGLHWSGDGTHLLISKGSIPRTGVLIDVTTGDVSDVAPHVYHSVVFTGSGLATVSELGVPQLRSEEPYVQPVLTTWTESQSAIQELPRTFAFAQDLAVPNCRLDRPTATGVERWIGARDVIG